MLKRALKIISAAALSVGLAFTLSTPAHAAGASEIPGTALNTNVTFTYEVTDDGGQVFVIKGTWGETYKDSYGDILVTLTASASTPRVWTLISRASMVGCGSTTVTRT